MATRRATGEVQGRAEADYELTVPDGTSLKVAVSALSKHLRRGREPEAL